MNKKLLCVFMAACLILTLAACGGNTTENAETAEPAEQEEEAAETTEPSEQEAEGTDVPKSEQTGTAGSNIPLKDNQEEAEEQLKIAMEKLIEDAYGDKVDDCRIRVKKIYTAEEEEKEEGLKSLNLGPDEVAFEVRYDLHPTKGTDINELMAATGKYNKKTGWVVKKFNLGVLKKNEDGTYEITNFGTGW